MINWFYRHIRPFGIQPLKWAAQIQKKKKKKKSEKKYQSKTTIKILKLNSEQSARFVEYTDCVSAGE